MQKDQERFNQKNKQQLAKQLVAKQLAAHQEQLEQDIVQKLEQWEQTDADEKEQAALVKKRS